jgi:adenine phosphoribosyltransferase
VSETIPTSPNKKIDVVIALDARGFLIGPVIALRLGAAFVPVRKRGKLPGECVQATYEKEYGKVRPNFTSLPSPFFFIYFIP